MVNRSFLDMWIIPYLSLPHIVPPFFVAENPR